MNLPTAENTIAVKRVKPYKLSGIQIMRLNHIHHTELQDFIVIYEPKEDTLYVNDRIPEEDIRYFTRLAGYEGSYLTDDEGEYFQEVDYIFEHYGKAAGILIDCYRHRREKAEHERAKSIARDIYTKINEWYLDDEQDHIKCSDYLLLELGQIARENSVRKSSIHNAVGIDKEYIFTLGYLLGAGVITKDVSCVN